MPDYIFNNQNQSDNTNPNPQGNPSLSHQEVPAQNGFAQQQQTASFQRPTESFAAPQNGESVYVSSPTQTPYTPSSQGMHAQAALSYPVPQPKQKKKHSNVALALVCAVCVILSGAAGFGGTLIANQLSQGTPVNSTQDTNAVDENSRDNAGVIYRSVATNTGTNGTVSGPGSIAGVAAAVENSVVEIITEFQTMSSFFQYVTEGAGSGVIITSDGYIVTNNHVISDSSSDKSIASKITVRLKNGSEYTATVIGTDLSSDIALLKIDAKNLSPVVFGDSDHLVVGEEVVAVGNPLGELGGTITNGIISALDREIEVDGEKMNLMQTNAAVNPGNSGGGLFNMKGELIGIVNAKSSGTGIEGLGFAIPSNDALNIVEQIRTYGYVRGRVHLGMNFLDISNDMQAYYYRVNALGVYISYLEKGLNDSQLQVGDRVTAVNGKEVSYFSEIKNIYSILKPGDTLTFTISRKGQLHDIQVVCYEQVPDGVKPVEFPS